MENLMIRFTSVCFVILSLVGCAAAQIQMSKSKLDVQTKMSATLFIDSPETENQKTVFIQAKNSSDQPFEISENLRRAFVAKGYRLVSIPRDAQFVVQLNVLQVGKFAPTAAEAAMYRGYGTAGDMMVDVAKVVNMPAANPAGAVNILTGMGLFGDVASIVANSTVKDVYFSVITDVQVKERLKRGTKSELSTVHFNQSGTSGETVARTNEKSDWKTSQTRILSSANKVNLDFATATPELKKALVQSVAGIF